VTSRFFIWPCAEWKDDAFQLFILLASVTCILKVVVFFFHHERRPYFSDHGWSFSKKFVRMACSCTKIPFLLFIDIAGAWRCSHGIAFQVVYLESLPLQLTNISLYQTSSLWEYEVELWLIIQLVEVHGLWLLI